MSGYWHQFHWWIVPAGLAFGWLNYKFTNWLVLPDGRWRWQKPREKTS